LYSPLGEAQGGGVAQSWKFRWLRAGKILAESRHRGLPAPSPQLRRGEQCSNMGLAPGAVQLLCQATHKGGRWV